MAGIALVTNSYWRDFEACRLLCDTIDAYVTGHDMHYVVVAPDDFAQFSVLAGPRRLIVDASPLLPLRLLELPLRWKGRRYHWHPRLTGPIYGWHLQQLFKIGITLALAEERVLHIDSDICFCRPFDVAGMLRDGRTPILVAPGGIDERLPQHLRWWHNAYRLLGHGEAPLPGDDFVGPLIMWERRSVAAMVARIEAITGRNWAEAIARVRDFSEYLLYGVAVTRDPELAARHYRVEESPCLTYWDGPALNEQSFAAFIAGLRPDQSAVAVQSFIGTPLALIRRFAMAQKAAA